jgi:hypothetical protein
MSENGGEDIVAQLERIALMAEVANHWTDDIRLMPASGVADVLHDAMDTIVDLRVDLETAHTRVKVAPPRWEKDQKCGYPAWNAKGLGLEYRIVETEEPPGKYHELNTSYGHLHNSLEECMEATAAQHAAIVRAALS